MMSVNEAKKIAEQWRGYPVDVCSEYEDAWMFIGSDDPMTIGGMGKVPCFVMKETGKTLSARAYFLSHGNIDMEKVVRYNIVKGQYIRDDSKWY